MLKSSLGVGIRTVLSIQTYHSFPYGYVVPELVPSLMDDAFHEMDLRSMSGLVPDLDIRYI